MTTRTATTSEGEVEARPPPRERATRRGGSQWRLGGCGRGRQRLIKHDDRKPERALPRALSSVQRLTVHRRDCVLNTRVRAHGLEAVARSHVRAHWSTLSPCVGERSRLPRSPPPCAHSPALHTPRRRVPSPERLPDAQARRLLMLSQGRRRRQARLRTAPPLERGWSTTRKRGSQTWEGQKEGGRAQPGRPESRDEDKAGGGAVAG